MQFHPELDGALRQRWIDDDREGEAASLGLETYGLVKRTAKLARAQGRVRKLVRGFLNILG